MLKKQGNNNYQKKFLNPVTLGIILIIAITGYFIWKTLNKKYQSKKLATQLLEQKKDAGKINFNTASVEEVYQWIDNNNVQLVDIRNTSDYKIKHIESSVNLPLETLMKSLKDIDKSKKIVIIDKENSDKGELLTEHLMNEGLDAKYLAGGILSYAQHNYPLITAGNPTDITNQMKVSSITAEEIKKKLLKGKIFSFIDTRRNEIFLIDHIKGSKNIPLEKIEKSKNELPSHTLLLYDADPTRSFQAGVKLYDMGISDVYTCSDNYTLLKKILFTSNNNNNVKKEN